MKVSKPKKEAIEALKKIKESVSLEEPYSADILKIEKYIESLEKEVEAFKLEKIKDTEMIRVMNFSLKVTSYLTFLKMNCKNPESDNKLKTITSMFDFIQNTKRIPNQLHIDSSFISEFYKFMREDDEYSECFKDVVVFASQRQGRTIFDLSFKKQEEAK